MKEITKKCNKCRVERCINEFLKDSSNNYYKRCKRCKEYDKKYKIDNKVSIRKYNSNNKEKINEYHREYYLKNRDRFIKWSKEYRLFNKEKVKEQSRKDNKIYYHKHKEQERTRLRKYNRENKDKIRQYKKAKYYNDPSYRVLQCLRARVRGVLRGFLKSQFTIELLGCTILELRYYLERHFMDGMNWENYGRGVGKWNVDHIIPCAIFDFTDSSEQKQCFHFSNLSPLWERGVGGNLEKSDRIHGLKLLYNDPTHFR